MSLFANVSRKIKEILGHLKAQSTCNEAVRIGPLPLKFAPDHLKCDKMCDKAVDV